jgi:hypothetical protein
MFCQIASINIQGLEAANTSLLPAQAPESARRSSTPCKAIVVNGSPSTEYAQNVCRGRARKAPHPASGPAWTRSARTQLHSKAVKYREWVLRCFRGNGCWAIQKVQAPDSASPPAIGSFPASRRPLETQLGALKSRASGPLFLQPCTRPSRGPRRTLAGDSP